MIDVAYRIELLKMIWPFQGGRAFLSDAGERVQIGKPGEYNSATDAFSGAEVVVDEIVFRGNVIFGTPDPSRTQYDNCILQVVPPDVTTHILKDDGSFLPQVTIDAGPVTQAAYGMLRDGVKEFGCAHYIKRFQNHERVALFTRLLADRLRRKCDELRAIFEEGDQNWNETMYVMLLRTIGNPLNKEPFTELARRVHYSHISRERNSLQYVEALLLGTSGLLELYDDDTYIRELKADFEYLRKKYSITPMMPSEWTMAQNNPSNHPVIRIAQLAAFLTTREFLFENLVKCRTVEHIQTLFRAEASEYWSTHYTPTQLSVRKTKRIGHFKANILGINLAVPMIFSYGDHMNDEKMKDDALDLLEKMNCEENKIIDGWRAGGVTMESAFDSQAVIQLNNEYCLKGMCRQCSLGRRVIRDVYTNEHMNRNTL